MLIALQAAFHNFHNDYAHIADPNERRRLALAEIDKAPFGWYHVRAIAVAGIGFFTDAYDIFAIGIVTTMLGIVCWLHSSRSRNRHSNANCRSTGTTQAAIPARSTRTRTLLSKLPPQGVQSSDSLASVISPTWWAVRRCTAWSSS